MSKPLALIALSVAGLLFLAHSARAEEEAVEVYSAVNGCVVALQNVEGSGTGILLDRTGLILTNAHVVTSPLPFKCSVDVLDRGKTETVTFAKVQVLGVHPEKDLALVRIDPKEHSGTLQTAKLSAQKAAPGQRVYAIGNPAGGGGLILNKTITSGILSGVDRIVEDVAYYQISAPINPGNSGGPLCDKDGNVIGLVTLKFTDVENVGFAIPLFDLDTKQFVPWSKRKGDPEQARELFDKAVEIYNHAQQLQKRVGPKSPEVMRYVAMSASLMHQSLMHDTGNYGLYYNVGMMLNSLGEEEAAEAYVRQALELQAWPERDGPLYYDQLGLSQVKQKKADLAIASWQEGIAKYAGQSGKVWEHVAVYNMNETHDYFEAAYAAAVARSTSDRTVQRDVLDKIDQNARGKLGPDEIARLDKKIAGIGNMLKQVQAQSDKQHRAGKKFLTESFIRYMEDAAVLAGESPAVAIAGSSRSTAERADTATAATPEPKRVAIDLTVPKGSLDLLAAVDVQRDSVQGSWKFEDKALVAPYTLNGRLVIPTAPPDEYDLTLTVERKSGRKEFVVGFVRDRVQSGFFIDANTGRNSFIDPSAPGAYSGQLLEKDKPVTIVCKVRHEGLLVMANGKRVFFDRTDAAFPEVAEEWQVGNPGRLFLGANSGRFTIHKAMLTPYVRQR